MYQNVYDRTIYYPKLFLYSVLRNSFTENINLPFQDKYIRQPLPPTFKIIKTIYKALEHFHIHKEAGKK